MAARSEASEQTDLGPFVVIAVGAGLLLWLLPKAFPRGFIPTPGFGGPPSDQGVHPVASSTATSWHRPVNHGLVSLLSHNREARKAYLFQAGMFSYHQTEELPDGKNGPVTRSLMDREAQALGTMNSFRTVNDTVLLNLANALRVLTGYDDLRQAPVRLVPGALPQGLINQINSEGLAVAADIPLLQIQAG